MFDIGEKLNIKKASMGKVIKDFQDSDAPQFKGKSNKKVRQMAIAAKLNTESSSKEKLKSLNVNSIEKREKANRVAARKARRNVNMQREETENIDEALTTKQKEEIRKQEENKHKRKKKNKKAEDSEENRQKAARKAKRKIKAIQNKNKEESEKKDKARIRQSEKSKNIKISNAARVAKKTVKEAQDDSGENEAFSSVKDAKMKRRQRRMKNSGDYTRRKTQTKTPKSPNYLRKMGHMNETNDSNDETESGNDHILMQVRKSISTGSKIKFKDGSSHAIKKSHAHKFHHKYMTAKPNEKSKMNSGGNSHSDFISHIK